MSASNFTPLSSKKSKLKKKHSSFKIVGILSSVILMVGVLAGFIMVQSGFNFRPRATQYQNVPAKYGWNGTCFTKFPNIILARRYQCPGRIDKWGGGCQGGKYITGEWTTRTGYSNVCVIRNGAPGGQRDAAGCFTQQLDLGADDGHEGPEAFVSFDSCASSAPPTEPKPQNPKPEPTPGKTDVYAACVGTTGTQATVNWTHVSDAQAYAFRLNYRDNDAPSCQYGWYCAEPPDKLVELDKNFTGNSVNLEVIPGHTYDFWVHAIRNGVPGESAATSFTCSTAVIPTETPTPTPQDAPTATPTPTLPPGIPTATPVLSCPVLPQPKNVRVSCPTCSGVGGASQQTTPPTSTTAPEQSQQLLIDESTSTSTESATTNDSTQTDVAQPE